MADYRQHTSMHGEPVEKRAKMAAGSSTAEGIAGIGAVALSIIGLVGIIPGILLAVATIAIGVALLFEGGTVAARYAALMSRHGKPMGAWAYGGGMTAQFLAGVAGIALGVLALLGIAPGYLLPIAAIVFGAALVLDSGANARLAALEAREYSEHALTEAVIAESSASAGSIQMLVGLGAITLGILALLGINTLTLSLVAMLALGSANLLTGTLVGSRMAKIFR